MLKDLFSKWFSNSSANKPKAPKTFKQKNRSIFINRYAGLVYFLVAWHTFGYFIIKLAKDNANQRGSFYFFLFTLNVKSRLQYRGDSLDGNSNFILYISFEKKRDS